MPGQFRGHRLDIWEGNFATRVKDACKGCDVRLENKNSTLNKQLADTE